MHCLNCCCVRTRVSKQCAALDTQQLLQDEGCAVLHALLCIVSSAVSVLLTMWYCLPVSSSRRCGVDHIHKPFVHGRVVEPI
jgi:hypothetical protein